MPPEASATLRDALAVAPLSGMLGKTGDTNVQGESTAKLDERANDIVCDALRLPSVARIISEEEPEVVEVVKERRSGYALTDSGDLVVFYRLHALGWYYAVRGSEAHFLDGRPVEEEAG